MLEKFEVQSGFDLLIYIKAFDKAKLESLPLQNDIIVNSFMRKIY